MKTVPLSAPTRDTGRAIIAVMHTVSHAMTRGCLWWRRGRRGRGHWSTAGLWSQWTQEGRPVPSRTIAMTSPPCSVRTTTRLHYRWHEKSQTTRWDSFVVVVFTVHQWANPLWLYVYTSVWCCQLWVGLRFLGSRWMWVGGEEKVQQVNLESCPVQKRCGTLGSDETIRSGECMDKKSFLCYKRDL